MKNKEFKQIKNISILVLVSLFAVACKQDNTQEIAITNIPMNVNVERFDQMFGNATANDLSKLKVAYPFMFSKKYSDAFWIAKMEDTLQQELVKEVQVKFESTKELENEIRGLFKHLKYYFPEFKPPNIITTTSNVDFRHKVVVTDTIVLVALDTYLGSDHKFYQNIQNFIKKDFESERIVVDLAAAYAKEHIVQSQRKTLLDEMVYFGKQLYFIKTMLPHKTEAEHIGYDAAELDWAKINEQYIWTYFIEKEVLYSTDTKLPKRFINPAPFSKFYIEGIDTESPGRLGQYMGLQIVKAYMTNNEISLRDMLRQKPEDILNTSKFKPRK